MGEDDKDFLEANPLLILTNMCDNRMVLEKLVDGKAVTEEEINLLLDLVGPEVGTESDLASVQFFET